LYDLKEDAVDSIMQVENSATALWNLPNETAFLVGEIVAERKRYADSLEKEKQDAEKMNGEISAGLSATGMGAGASGKGLAAAGIGAAAGAGVAALGPTAALAVATTFGTTAGGTAIATLTGAAATNAALAWLGGGALVAGGAGMAGGGALLALLGPIGIGIGGIGLLTGGLIANKKNKDVAKKVEEQTKTLRKETMKQLQLRQRVDIACEKIAQMNTTVRQIWTFINSTIRTKNYGELNEEVQAQLLALLHQTNSLAHQVNEKIG
jgi:hypothetical protein